MYTLSKPSVNIITTANTILQRSSLTVTSPTRLKATALFNYVRDNIQFGFTPFFDNATPEQTLNLKRGHCNPQGALFASLCNAAQLPATQHFVQIPNDVLYGVLGPFGPPKLLHSFVEVTVDDQLCRVDGYIPTKNLFHAACRRLDTEHRIYGYGVAKEGSVDWDGTGDCFSQMVGGMEKDFGTWDEPTKFLDSEHNFQNIGVVGKLAFGLVARVINGRIDAIQAGECNR